jgi:hypothetical protein
MSTNENWRHRAQEPQESAVLGANDAIRQRPSRKRRQKENGGKSLQMQKRDNVRGMLVQKAVLLSLA